MKLYFGDFEAANIKLKEGNKRSSYLVNAGIVSIDLDTLEERKLDIFVKPYPTVTNKDLEYCNVTLEDIKDGCTIEECFKQMNDFIEPNSKVFVWGTFDNVLIKKELERLTKDSQYLNFTIENIQSLIARKIGLNGKLLRLAFLKNLCELKEIIEHKALADAIDLKDCYMYLEKCKYKITKLAKAYEKEKIRIEEVKKLKKELKNKRNGYGQLRTNNIQEKTLNDLDNIGDLSMLKEVKIKFNSSNKSILKKTGRFLLSFIFLTPENSFSLDKETNKVIFFGNQIENLEDLKIFINFDFDKRDYFITYEGKNINHTFKIESSKRLRKPLINFLKIVNENLLDKVEEYSIISFI